MKRYAPFLFVVAGIVGALWYFWPDVLSARKKRQDDLDAVLATADAKAAADAKAVAPAAKT